MGRLKRFSRFLPETLKIFLVVPSTIAKQPSLTCLAHAGSIQHHEVFGMKFHLGAILVISTRVFQNHSYDCLFAWTMIF